MLYRTRQLSGQLGKKKGRSEGAIRIPGGTFRMGSDTHYPEEAPVHRVTVDGFWIDRTPITNRRFKGFVGATGQGLSRRSLPIRKTIRARCRACSTLRTS